VTQVLRGKKQALLRDLMLHLIRNGASLAFGGVIDAVTAAAQQPSSPKSATSQDLECSRA
jgi:hypothetical protein